MIRRWTIALAIVVIGLMSLSLTCKSEIVPYEECSTIYQRYFGREGLQVAFIRSLPIDDSVALDVTQIMATDSTAWQKLNEDFGIRPLPERHTGSKSVVAMILTNKEHPEKHMGFVPGETDLTLVSSEMLCITVFHVKTNNDKKHLLHREVYKIKNRSKKAWLCIV